MFSLNFCFSDLSDSLNSLELLNSMKVLLHLGKTPLCPRIIANCKLMDRALIFLTNLHPCIIYSLFCNRIKKTYMYFISNQSGKD